MSWPKQPDSLWIRCLADLGHFVELKLQLNFWAIEESDPPSCAVQELSRAILANPNLKLLDICNSDHVILNWDPHFGVLFKSLIGHKTLRVLQVDVEDEEIAFGPEFIYLRQLLSHNRRIIVTNDKG
jgi:hypothetical protein